MSYLLAAKNNAAINIRVQVDICFDFHFSWYMSGSAIAGHMVTLCLSFLGTARLFSKAAAPFYIPSSSV